MSSNIVSSNLVGEKIYRLLSVGGDEELSNNVFSDLIRIQRDSYNDFIDRDNPNGFYNIFQSIFPFDDIYGRLTLDCVSCDLGKPSLTPQECVQRGGTYAAPFSAKLRLTIWELEDKDGIVKEPNKLKARVIDKSSDRKSKHVIEQNLYIGDIPMMTENGTFVVNGTERVIVSQMHRAPGVFFGNDSGKSSSAKLAHFARIIPYRGSWLDFEFDTKGMVFFRLDKKRKLPVSILLSALKMDNKQIYDAFYCKINCEYDEETNAWIFPFDPEIIRGTRLRDDLIDADTRKIVLKRGVRVTTVIVKQLKLSGLKRYLTNFDVILGMYVGEDIYINDESIDDKVLLFHIGHCITIQDLKKIEILKLKSIVLLNIDNMTVFPYIRDTIFNHEYNYEVAMLDIYKVMRPGEIATLEIAERYFNGLLFDPKKYDLLHVGRIRINARFSSNIDENCVVLTCDDIVNTIKELCLLQDGYGEIDDIDHLGNRRIRSVGEFIENQFRIGILRMEKITQEYITTTNDLEKVMPSDLINSKVLIAVIKEFFISSQLSQFMDHTNPLSEITHKRRLSALGPGGLTRERAGFEVRDVHPSHYGRICPIETPEGQNIGLISSLAAYARINTHGFIESPYLKVENNIVTKEIKYLSAIEEERYNIADANSKLDENSMFVENFVYCRQKKEVVLLDRSEIHYIDVSPKQMVSVATSLIPFLENDDANRALMGANMQRQAVPLIRPQFPIVGTGMEHYVANGSGTCVIAKRSGIVDYVDSSSIIIRSEDKEDIWVDRYDLIKFQKTNHNTCINQQSLVFYGDKVKKGMVIADGAAVDNGELALGLNVKVAFLSYYGGSYEDAIIVSDRIAPWYSSVHIEEFECIVRDTKLGPEEITRDIPNVAEELLYNLDEHGIAHIGVEVEAGDVLVGKVTPKSESPLTAEEKLLKAVFGEKAIDVYDTSLYAPPGISGGVVIDVRILIRRGLEKKGRVEVIERCLLRDISDRKNRFITSLNSTVFEKWKDLVRGKEVTKNLTKLEINKGDILDDKLFSIIDSTSFWNIQVSNFSSLDELKTAYNIKVKDIESSYEEDLSKLEIYDELAHGVLYVIKVFVAVKQDLQSGDKMSGRHGNKGVVSKIVPVEDMPYLSDGTPIDILLNPLGVPSRMNIGQILEVHLGWVAYKLGKKISSILDGGSFSELQSFLTELYNKTPFIEKLNSMSKDEVISYARKNLIKGIPVAAPVFQGPSEERVKELFNLADSDVSGQEILYDGCTGEPFERPVTVGIAYMLKLNHLVSYKIHARSVGPYSLITQQPLGGKSHKGGQRMGEMEIWGIEGHGAGAILSETLTIKSDDICGRNSAYASIISGNNDFVYSTPESLNVLMNELKALGLNIQAIKIDEECINSENNDHSKLSKYEPVDI